MRRASIIAMSCVCHLELCDTVDHSSPVLEKVEDPNLKEHQHALTV